MGMPNEVYHHTRSSLMTIVSANVADSTLESVISASGLTQDTVDANHMMELVRGPIYREFQTIVPKDGLRRQLSKLLSELQHVDGQDFGDTPSDKIKQKTSRKQRIPGLTTINKTAIGIPRAYFRDPREDNFNLQMPLHDTDPHVVLDNGTRAVVRYWISEVGFVDLDELQKAGFRRYSFMLEEESHDNPTIVKLLEILRAEEEAEQESRRLEQLASEAKAAAERDIAEQEARQDRQKELAQQAASGASNATARATVHETVHEKVNKIRVAPADIESLAQQYSEIEDVRFIATLSSDGTVISAKGKGLDIEKIKEPVFKSLSRMRIDHYKTQHPQQVEHFSRCKSILIEHESGVLYVIDYIDVIVLVYGNSDVNIGLMYTYAANVQEAAVSSGITDLSSGFSDEDFKDFV